MATLAPQDVVEVRPVAGYIGAEVHSVDLGAPLDGATVAEIRRALLQYKVLFFRDQHIGHAEQVAFSALFGEVTPAHPYEDAPPEGFPQVLPVDTRRNERKFGAKYFDNQWHTDVTPLVNPPAATILRAERVPSRGGDTSWTNLVAAYEGLSAPLRALADGLRAEHRFGARRPGWTEDSAYAEKTRKEPLVAVHPVVRVHPETGERALYVTPGFTSRIVGLSPRESDHLLGLFFDEITDPRYTVRFRWAPGSLAFWDNRATAHLAPSDLDHFDEDRVLYRTTLVGDVPVGPDGTPSEAVRGQPFVAARSN